MGQRGGNHNEKGQETGVNGTGGRVFFCLGELGGKLILLYTK